MSQEIIDLLEGVVKTSWKEEIAWSKAFFKTEPKETDSLCQGISRKIYHKIIDVFPNSFRAKFEVKGKTHIVVYIAHDLKSYVIDGTIKQFSPEEKRTVFLRQEYPFKEEMQKSEEVIL